MPHDIAPGATSNKPLDPVRRAPRPRRPAAVTGSDHARRRPGVPRRREEEPGRKRDCGWRPGELRIGDIVLPCAVLPDGTRLISQGAMATAFGPVTGGWQMRKRAASKHKGDLPPFLVAASLKPFISNELSTLVSGPTKYKDPRGGATQNRVPRNCAAEDMRCVVEGPRPPSPDQNSRASCRACRDIDERTSARRHHRPSRRGHRHIRKSRDRIALHHVHRRRQSSPKARSWPKRFPDRVPQ